MDVLYTFFFDSMIREYHEYIESYRTTPIAGENLPVIANQLLVGNAHDPYAVAVKKNVRWRIESGWAHTKTNIGYLLIAQFRFVVRLVESESNKDLYHMAIRSILSLQRWPVQLPLMVPSRSVNPWLGQPCGVPGRFNWFKILFKIPAAIFTIDSVTITCFKLKFGG